MGELAGKLRVGDPTLAETEVGPLIRHKEVLRIDQRVKEALDGGGRLICGGRALSESCYAPTVLLDPPDDCNPVWGVGGIPHTFREMQIEKMFAGPTS